MKILFKHENGFFLDGKVFCEVYCYPENETNDQLLSDGWNPSMEEQGVWYQSRSCRIRLDSFKLSSKRKNILNKLSVNFFDYINQKNIDEFFYNYYKEKSFDIFDLYTNCSNFFKLKIIEVKFNQDIVAYARYVENKDSNLFVNLAYSKNLPKLSLGTNTFYILSEFTKLQNKKYLYIYESYESIFSYKQKIENVETWNGRIWIN